MKLFYDYDDETIYTEEETRSRCTDCSISCGSYSSTPCEGLGIDNCDSVLEVKLSEGLKKLLEGGKEVEE